MKNFRRNVYEETLLTLYPHTVVQRHTGTHLGICRDPESEEDMFTPHMWSLEIRGNRGRPVLGDKESCLSEGTGRRGETRHPPESRGSSVVGYRAENRGPSKTTSKPTRPSCGLTDHTSFPSRTPPFLPRTTRPRRRDTKPDTPGTGRGDGEGTRRDGPVSEV